MKHINKLFVFIVVLLVSSVLFLPISPNGEHSSSLYSYFLKLSGRSTETPKISTLILGGDVMLGRTVMTTSLDKGDPTYPFAKISDITNSADLVFVNLENPIVDNCPREYESLVFCTRPEMVEGLTSAGIDIVTLGNNHSKNYGKTGFENTKKYLNEKGVDYVGDENLIIRDVNGTRFGFLGFDFVSNKPADADYDLVHESAQKVEVLVVGVHWGIEYRSEPNDTQIEIANKLVQSGASVVVGHHPHWVQTTDHIGDSPVYYSLGNLVFDQMWSERTKSGLMMKLTFTNGVLTNEEEIRTYMTNWAQPEIVN